jgi:hypothetical protein
MELDLLPSYNIFAHTFSQFVSRSKSVPAFVICVEISNDSENESTDNIGLPTYTSSPIQTKNSEPLRVLTINFQSIGLR